MEKEKMRAFICNGYGNPSVLELKEVNKPEPKEDEILVKVKSFGVTSGDVRIRSSKFPIGFKILGRLGLGITKPRNGILGSEFSGIIEEIGGKVKNFKVGESVMGFRVFNIYG